MKNIDEFFREWDGKHCEYSGGGDANNQCIDVVNMYIDNVLGQQPFLCMNAKDVYNNASSDIYEKILNTDDTVPQRGDIIVWTSWDYGHIAIAEGTGDTGWFRSFDQNFPIGSVCHYVDHGYSGVKGFLRLKKGEDMTDGQRLDVAKALCRARCGRLYDNEVNYIFNEFGPDKKPYEDYSSNNVIRDNNIPVTWYATTGNRNCPKNEIDYWQNVFIRNEAESFDLAGDWFKRFVQPIIDENIKLKNTPPKIEVKEINVEKIVEVKVPQKELTAKELWNLLLKKIFG